MEFTAEITGTSTVHCSEFDGRDSTGISLRVDQKLMDAYHTSEPYFTVTGPTQEMQKFVDARKAAYKNQKLAKVKITIDLEEPEESSTPTPLPLFTSPIFDAVFTLALN